MVQSRRRGRISEGETVHRLVFSLYKMLFGGPCGGDTHP